MVSARDCLILEDELWTKMTFTVTEKIKDICMTNHTDLISMWRLCWLLIALYVETIHLLSDLEPATAQLKGGHEHWNIFIDLT